MVRILVWCGGDVTNYYQVNYKVENQRVSTFLAPAALNDVFNFDVLVALIPSTLFTVNHAESYRKLLEAKSMYQGLRLVGVQCFDDGIVHKILDKGFRSYVVPHGGLSSPITLKIQGNEVAVDRGSQVFSSYDFNVTFNAVYAALRDCIMGLRDGNVELHIDLTHGSNVLITALMLASQIIAEVEELQAEKSLFLWCAPVLTRPQPSVAVEFLDVSKASNIARELITGAHAWRRIDERFLPTRLYEEVGCRLGREFKGVYGQVKSILREAEELLWTLRSGQAPLAYKLCKEICQGDGGDCNRINTARANLDSMIRSKYLVEGWLNTDEPWIPIADAAIELTDKLIKSLTSKGWDPINITTTSLRKMLEAEYHDKVIAVAREYAIYLMLRKLCFKAMSKTRIGEGAWQQLDEAIKQIHLAQRGQADTSLTALYQCMLKNLDINSHIIGEFDELRQMRNKLMHGGLSREFQADIELASGRILDINSNQDKKPIDKAEAERKAKEAIELIKKLNTLKDLNFKTNV